jgi:hypothetical protein
MRARTIAASLISLSSLLLGSCSEAASNGATRVTPDSGEMRSAEAAAQQAAEYASRAARQVEATQRKIDISHHCNDSVVIGSIHNFDEQHRDAQGDITLYGRFSARVKVKRAVSGAALAPYISATYFAHTYLREGTDFLLILHPKGADGFVIERAVRPVGGLPRLASQCSGRPIDPTEFRRG